MTQDQSGPTLQDFWRMVLRDPPPALNLGKAVEDMAWLISSGTAPPYELAGPHDSDGGNRPTTYRNSRLEDGNGNELQLEHVAAVLNHVPALLLRLKLAEEVCNLATRTFDGVPYHVHIKPENAARSQAFGAALLTWKASQN